MSVSEEIRRNRRRRDVIALVIHDAHCDGDTDCGEGVSQADLDRATNLIEALDQIDAELGYAPTCSTCGVTVSWSAEAGDQPVHDNQDAAYRAAGGAHPVKLRGPVARP